MRKFRAIVESLKEPEDHEVIWYRKGELLYWGNDAWEPLIKVTEGPEKIPYKNENDESISTVKEALDKSIDGVADLNNKVNEISNKVYYPKPEVVFFECDQAGIHEVGEVLNPLKFTWETEGKVTSLKFNGVEIPVDTTEFIINGDVKEDTTYTLEAGNDSGTTIMTIDIRFVEFIYCGVTTGQNKVNLKRIGPFLPIEFTGQPCSHPWRSLVLVPDSLDVSNVWYNGVLCRVNLDYYKSSEFYENNYGKSIPCTTIVSVNSGVSKPIIKLT